MLWVRGTNYATDKPQDKISHSNSNYTSTDKLATPLYNAGHVVPALHMSATAALTISQSMT